MNLFIYQAKLSNELYRTWHETTRKKQTLRMATQTIKYLLQTKGGYSILELVIKIIIV